MNRDRWRDRRIKQIEIEIVDATDQRYLNLSTELADLIAESNAERGIHHETPLDLQEPTPTPNDAFRASLRRAREVREAITEKQSRTQGSVTGGVMRTNVLDTDANGLPL